VVVENWAQKKEELAKETKKNKEDKNSQMNPAYFIKRIKVYSIISFIVPLLAINLCLMSYQFLGKLEIRLHADLDWEKKEITIPYDEYTMANEEEKNLTFLNCPKYFNYIYYITTDNKIIYPKIDENKYNSFEISKDGTNYKTIKKSDSQLIADLVKNKKLKSIIAHSTKIPNPRCVKNHPKLYEILKKSSFLNKMLIAAWKNKQGFSVVRNPYIYGEVSISRTARYFPATLIFKPLIILTALLLLLYWKNNLNLFNELKNKNIINNFTKSFFYLGLFSCFFLLLHAIFLGIDFDSKVFGKVRRLIIILFIFFELSAQIILTKILFTFKEKLRDYVKPSIITFKVIFVITVFFLTLASLAILILGDPSNNFKHILEWNYFSFLMVYYFLSRLLWK